MGLLDNALDSDSLPRGRHGLSRADVARSQRGRLCLALIDITAEVGFHSLSINSIARRANVSKKAFYEQFQSLDDCFADALRACVGVAVTEIDKAVAAEGPGLPPWQRLLDISISAYLDTLASEPGAARVMHTEAASVGPISADARLQMVAIFADRMRVLSEIAETQDPTGIRPRERSYEYFVYGLDGTVWAHLATRTPESLPELAAPIVSAARALFLRP
ncbi:TetR/AcrR family transcriptional regulator [Gordonia malaquae]|uniref:TetR/AcrR family transcriptional regulator n=1 Tax=Gordonia malaquae TaxID=410332 RepID=UPI0030FED682